MEQNPKLESILDDGESFKACRDPYEVKVMPSLVKLCDGSRTPVDLYTRKYNTAFGLISQDLVESMAPKFYQSGFCTTESISLASRVYLRLSYRGRFLGCFEFLITATSSHFLAISNKAYQSFRKEFIFRNSTEPVFSKMPDMINGICYALNDGHPVSIALAAMPMVFVRPATPE